MGLAFQQLHFSSNGDGPNAPPPLAAARPCEMVAAFAALLGAGAAANDRRARARQESVRPRRKAAKARAVIADVNGFRVASSVWDKLHGLRVGDNLQRRAADGTADRASPRPAFLAARKPMGAGGWHATCVSTHMHCAPSYPRGHWRDQESKTAPGLQRLFWTSLEGAQQENACPGGKRAPTGKMRAQREKGGNYCMPGCLACPAGKKGGKYCMPGCLACPAGKQAVADRPAPKAAPQRLASF